MQTPDHEKIALLISMGFPEAQARHALDVCQGNIDMAVDRILSGTDMSWSHSENPPPSPSLSSFAIATDDILVEALGGMSQYSLSHGESACTCIALHIASTALEYLDMREVEPTIAARQFFTQERLQSMLLAGVELYNFVKSGQINSGPAPNNSNNNANSSLGQGQDHFSPEQVLAYLDSTNPPGWKGNLKLLDGGIRQGLLSKDPDLNRPLSLHSILDECHRLAQPLPQTTTTTTTTTTTASLPTKDGAPWICAIITKPPETVCVLLPPPPPKIQTLSSTDHQHHPTNSNNSLPFLLVDTHPRPGLGVNGAHVKFHSSLERLVCTLTEIFPYTHFGNDQDSTIAEDEMGDWMTAMYNSFDVYPFILVEEIMT